MMVLMLPMEFFLKMTLLIKVLMQLSLCYGPVLGELQSCHCSDC